MGETGDFRDIQYAFARHIRDPENNPAPTDAEDRRMAVYRELFFNNLRNLISQTFPVLRKLHGRDKWDSFIRQFMARHEAHTPYFLEIPKEFLAFLQDEYEPDDDDYPFLVELAHYEWAELALSVSDEENDPATIDPAGDLLDGIPVKSRLSASFGYAFPVHRISTDFTPREPGEQPTFLAICRKANDEMGFMELNPVTARLLEMIESNATLSGRALLTTLAEETGFGDTDRFIEHGLQAMTQMRDAEIVAGTLITHV
jgi:hypothetical protein